MRESEYYGLMYIDTTGGPYTLNLLVGAIEAVRGTNHKPATIVTTPAIFNKIWMRACPNDRGVTKDPDGNMVKFLRVFNVNVEESDDCREGEIKIFDRELRLLGLLTNVT